MLDLSEIPTTILEREAKRLEIRIIHGIASDLELESYCLVQMELGRRDMRKVIIDPRD